METEQQLPNPRKGLPGILDRFAGPGATPAELALQFLLPLVAAGAAVAYAALAVGAWSGVQYVLCALLAFDIVGGIITNATSSGKRWYHRAGQGFSRHFGFVMLHLGHLAIVSWLFLTLDLLWLVTTGMYLLIASLTIILVPLYLQRPVALVMYAGSIPLALYVLASPPGLEWFLPLFYLKLLVAHLPREEAYRPESEASKGMEPTRTRASQMRRNLAW
ncbi:hypothetical protein [Thioalkalivibrio sp. XN8]|uniref:hypothetical protein n=1 Tax=Thioalkalivibrio sp. XN8 TaxID=2712863 RepID=UPI0013ED1A6C|nr:hypothetical protein [Thioalkalivibrio sp. XN8]NGP53539.1 hypothetical protein [Thioalkalivibrio sp. XN8]